MRLTGNTIVVTGGGSGIGRGLAEALHRAGNRVVVAGRRRDRLRDVADANPGIEYIQVDLSDPMRLESFVEHIIERYRDLNVVVNNAGIMPLEDLSVPDPGIAQSIVSTNLLAPIMLTSLLLPTLKQNPLAAIINVTSTHAFVPKAVLPTYSATKAGLHSYTESLRFQLHDKGIQVIEIAPPRVNTYMSGGLVDDPYTMELDAFIAETLSRLTRHPEAGEVVVTAARALRYAERNGVYAEQFSTVNATP
jgi:uncharacterized oxidoreductase